MSDSVNLRQARATAISQYDDNLYIPPLSNIFLSTILRRADINYSIWMDFMLRFPAGICSCYPSTYCVWRGTQESATAYSNTLFSSRPNYAGFATTVKTLYAAQSTSMSVDNSARRRQ